MDAAEQQQETAAFDGAVAAFAEEDSGAPNAVVEGEAAKAPEPEAEPKPEQEPPKEAAKSEVEKLDEEFVEFTGKQKERFNSVYGALKRLERENADLQRRVQQPAPVVPQQQFSPVVQPQLFNEPKPKLAEFQDADQWADAISDWSARKAEHSAIQHARQEFTQQQSWQQQQAEQTRVQQFLEAKTSEGYQKFGQIAFDNVCADIVTFAPPGSLMNQALFGLQFYPEVVMQLGKNLTEADRISRLPAHDLIYELKSLEKKLSAKTELAAKTQKPNPTKVEAPGQGEDLKNTPQFSKLKRAAFESGSLHDFARLFKEDPTL